MLAIRTESAIGRDHIEFRRVSVRGCVLSKRLDHLELVVVHLRDDLRRRCSSKLAGDIDGGNGGMVEPGQEERYELEARRASS